MTVEAMTANPRPGVFDRMTQILDVFLANDGRLLLDDVSKATGLPRSTTFRMLSQLVDLHWLEHTGRGYRLGIRVRSMRGLETDELRAAAAPVLNELHLRTRSVAHLAVLDGPVVRCLDKIGGPMAASIPTQVGAKVAPDRTVAGRTLLSGLSPEVVEDLLAILPGRRRTRDEMTTLHMDLDQVRTRAGLAIDVADAAGSGITAVSAPVHGPTGVVGAIWVATREPVSVQSISPLVVVAARRVSAALGAPGQAGGRAPAARATGRTGARQLVSLG